MRLVAAEVVPLRLALRQPLVTARGTIAERRGFLLRLRAGDGTVGTGEASPAYWIGEGDLAATAADLDRVVALIRGGPTLEEARSWLDAPPGTAALAPAAACGLDEALLDLAALARGVPVAALLGRGRDTQVPLAALVGGATLAGLQADVDAAVAAGYATLKLKVGAGDLATDEARVAAVRVRAGTTTAIRLDANGAWTYGDAERALAAFAPHRIAYLEEPLRDADPERLAALARTTAVPLAVDESLRGANDLERVIAADAHVHVVTRAARVGGPTRLVALAVRARAAGLPVTVTDAVESAVGMRMAVHAAAALGAPVAAVGLGGAQLCAGQDALRVPELAAQGPGSAVTPSDRGIPRAAAHG